MKSTVPKPPSEGEEDFALQCRIYNVPVVREFQFHPTRKWRFDFCVPDKLLAIEIEGGTWSGGRHTRGAGYAADLEKYNAAAMMGYRVFRFTTQMVHSGNAIDTIVEAMK